MSKVIRCGNYHKTKYSEQACTKILFKIKGDILEIKCPKCGIIKNFHIKDFKKNSIESNDNKLIEKHLPQITLDK